VYNIIYENAAQKQLDKLPQNIASKIKAKIEELSDNPRPNGCTKLTGFEAYRIKIGDYRVIYTIEDSILTVTVVRVSHRRDVYR
jgi:mRNA interferase RelE/StbE